MMMVTVLYVFTRPDSVHSDFGALQIIYLLTYLLTYLVCCLTAAADEI